MLLKGKMMAKKLMKARLMLIRERVMSKLLLSSNR